MLMVEAALSNGDMGMGGCERAVLDHRDAVEGVQDRCECKERID